MGNDDDATERTAVKTYVPRYQKDEWRDHADELDMSQSEFVRAMVQAGRRGFSLEPGGTPSEEDEPQGSGLEDRVVSYLREGGPTDWDQLVDALAGDFEDRLEDALDDLQRSNRVRYSPRDGGYVLEDGG